MRLVTYKGLRAGDVVIRRAVGTHRQARYESAGGVPFADVLVLDTNPDSTGVCGYWIYGRAADTGVLVGKYHKSWGIAGNLFERINRR
jgi:hypothetical protein